MSRTGFAGVPVIANDLPSAVPVITYSVTK